MEKFVFFCMDREASRSFDSLPFAASHPPPSFFFFNSDPRRGSVKKKKGHMASIRTVFFVFDIFLLQLLFFRGYILL